MTEYYVRPDAATEAEESLLSDVNLISSRLANSPQTYVVEGDDSKWPAVLADAVVPLIYHGNVIGFLLVRSDDVSNFRISNFYLGLSLVFRSSFTTPKLCLLSLLVS
jgi:putative methionine-R-sulfoxide reductase with GAF domain